MNTLCGLGSIPPEVIPNKASAGDLMANTIFGLNCRFFFVFFFTDSKKGEESVILAVEA